MRSLPLWLLLLFAAPAAASEDVWSSLRVGETVRVVEVIDGDTVEIEPAPDGMNQVRLVGIQAPKLPLGRTGFKAWPLAHEARDALVELALGRTATLHFGGRRADRHARLLAHLRLDDGVWVQGEMLQRGWARVYSFADNRALVPRMLALETMARENRAGIWDHPNYAVRTVDETPGLIGRFELIEGVVSAAAVIKGRGYLNFGADWRTDFTLTAAKRDLKRFKADGIDFASFEGRRVRARGWLKSFNGPMIEITHPEQIELLP